MNTKTETNSAPRQSWKSYAQTLENRLAHLEDDHARLQTELKCLQDDSKLLTEQAAYAIYEIEFYGKHFTRVNDAMCRITGYTREDLLAMNPLDLLDDEGRRTFQERLRKVQAGETVEPEVEYSINGKNGRKIYALLTTSIRYIEGKPHSHFVIAHEITERKQMEDALRLSQQKTSQVLESISDAFYSLDQDGRFIYVNCKALSLWGKQTEDLIGKNIWEVFPSGIHTDSYAKIQQALADKQPNHYETYSAFLNQWTDINLYPTETGLSVYFQDITERKKVEQSLQESEERERLRAAQMEAVLEALPVGVSITDVQGRIIQTNHAYEQIWGNRREQFRSAQDYHDNKAWWADTGKPLKSGEWASAQAIKQGKAVIGQVLEIQRFDGSRGYILNSASPVHDDLGNIFGSAVAIQDITRLRLAEQELKEANLRLEQRVEERTQALKQMYDRVRLLAEVYDLLTAAGRDLPGVLTSVVRKTSEIFDGTCALRLLDEHNQWLVPATTYDPDPQRGNALAESLIPTSQTHIEQEPGDVSRLATGQLFQGTGTSDWNGIESGDFTAFLKTSRATSHMVVPLRIGQQVIGTLGLVGYTLEKTFTKEELVFLQEVADRAALAIHNARLYKDLEHSLSKERDLRQQLIQSEKYAALARLVGSVAHELNNPLQAIQNCVFLLKDAAPQGEPQELVEMIGSEARRMSMLVQQLRETYRPSRFNYEKFNVLEVMSQAFNLLAPKLRQNKVEWELNSTHPHILLYGIPDQIKQVFINIILNAIEALGEDGGRIVARVSLDDGHVRITFEDTGCGIYPEDLGKVFEPFFTTKVSGTGLGLPISYEIVKNHQGEISVESTLGKGARFSIQLPLAPSTQVEA